MTHRQRPHNLSFSVDLFSKKRTLIILSFHFIDGFERGLRSFERDVRKRYGVSLRGMERIELPFWLIRLLKDNVFPGLSRIGFDELFEQALFKMAAHAWQSMGSVGDNVELIYPVLMKNIREIRRGIISDSRKNSRARSILDAMDPQATYSLINRTMHPAKLVENFDDISFSWIILPRAYDLLEKNH